MDRRRMDFCISGESVKLVMELSSAFRVFLVLDAYGVVLSLQVWQLFFCGREILSYRVMN